MIPLFLHGGGEQPDVDLLTFGGLIQKAKAHENGRILLVLAAADVRDMEEWCSAYVKGFITAGAQVSNIVSIFLGPNNPLTLRKVQAIAPSGVFVCGGATPLYQEVLCAEPEWVDYLREGSVPYGGTSAGAAVAADRALIGGWRVKRGAQMRQMIVQDASEELDHLTVRNGLNLVPCSIDVHASQWGTLTRLIHAVDTGVCNEGYAIDENSVIIVDDEGARVDGIGHVYRVWRDEQGTHLRVHIEGDRLAIA